MKKRVLALFMSVTMILSMASMTAFAADFSDMPNNWSTEALKNAVSNGLLEGNNGKIRPVDSLMRSEMATIINRAFNAKETASIGNFTDVKSSDWFYTEMSKAVAMETFMGSGNKLSPKDNITRQEVFVVLARAFNIPKSNGNSLNQFADQNKISGWAREEVAALVSEGYVDGSDGNINPLDKITRAEFAKMMDNLVKTYLTTEGTHSKDYNGNVMINKANVSLKGSTITGDLIIGDGVGDAEVVLEDVNITGRLVIRSGTVKRVESPNEDEIEDAIVTYINATRIELDNNVYPIDLDTKLVKDGVTLEIGSAIYTGANALVVGDQVNLKNNVITFVSSETQRAEAKATTAVIKAEGSRLSADILAAQTLVDGLATGTVKTDLQNRINAIQPPATDLQLATTAVNNAVTTRLTADITAAQLLVNGLSPGTDRVGLQTILNGITPLSTLVSTSGDVTTTGKEATTASALVPAVAANVTVDTNILVTAKTAGIAGNNITFEIVQSTEDNKALEVKVTGKDVKVTLPTDAAGTPIAVSRNNLATVINNDVAASALVVASSASTTTTAPVARIALKNGAEEIPAVATAPAVKQVYTLTINSGVTTTGIVNIEGIGASIPVNVVSGMTAELVADAIGTNVAVISQTAALNTAGYDVTVVGNKVIFTAKIAGKVGTTGPTAELDITLE